MSDGAANRCFLLTPPGPGAIAVIRVTGPDAWGLVSAAFRRRTKRATDPPCPDRLLYGDIVADGEAVDDVILSVNRRDALPAVDICAHGGTRVVERILHTLNQLGAAIENRHARHRGSWAATNRIEQEALDALQDARTHHAVRFLAWQRRYLPGRLQDLAAALTGDRSVEAWPRLRKLLQRSAAATTLLDGMKMVIFGPPNSGKSTLFNHLVGRAASIVSPRAGTTRDWVSCEIEIEGVPVTVLDTAGIHESPDELEKLAIEAGVILHPHADIRLLILDGSRPPTPTEAHLYRTGLRQPGCIVVLNKSDLRAAPVSAWASVGWDGTASSPIQISAETGEGVERLIGQLLRLAGYRPALARRSCLFTQRQRDLATRCLRELRADPGQAARTIRDDLIGGQAVTRPDYEI